MHLYTELWKARPEWLRLSARERRAYLNRVSPASSDATDACPARLVGFAVNKPQPFALPVVQDDDRHYLAVWKLSGSDATRDLDVLRRDAGWYDYFDPVETEGNVLPLPASSAPTSWPTPQQAAG
jgi:hypothetical protein